MIAALARVPAYRLMHALGLGTIDPMNVTISTTFRCNSRCLTCNVYERPVDELDAKEWERVFVALGRAPVWFTFSGGEPFLRKDLPDIIESAWRGRVTISPRTPGATGLSSSSTIATSYSGIGCPLEPARTCPGRE